MTNKELQMHLAQYPDDLPVKWLTHNHPKYRVIDFDTERFTLRSDTVYVDPAAPEDEWDTEDGKIELGDGQQFILFNPVIV